MANLFQRTKRNQQVKIGKPKWLKSKISSGEEYKNSRTLWDENNLQYHLQSGKCPEPKQNAGELEAAYF